MKDYSQNGESKVLATLFQKIGIDKGFFVDIGAGDGFNMSNTRYFKEIGWDGVMFDIAGENDVIKLRVTKENVNAVMPKDFNLLSLDIDGNDYWVLDEILSHHSPDVICFEINSEISLTEALIMPYNADHKWDGTNAFGMSYKAGFNLCKDHGYKVYAIVSNQNIIAIREDINVECPLTLEYGKTKSHPEKLIEWISN